MINLEVQKLIDRSINPELCKELYLLIANILKEDGSVFSTNSGKEMIDILYNK